MSKQGKNEYKRSVLIFILVFVVSAIIAVGLKLKGFTIETFFETESKEVLTNTGFSQPTKLNFNIDEKFAYEVNVPTNYIRKTEKELSGVGYPKKLITLTDQQLMSVTCGPMYTSAEGGFEAFVRGVKQTLSQSSKGFELLKLGQEKMGQKMSFFQSCDVENGTKLFVFGGSLNSGRTMVYFGLLKDGVASYLGVDNENMNTTCSKALAMTKDSVLYYKCSDESKNILTSTIYEVDFVGRNVARLISCVNTPRGDNRSTDIKCSN